MTDLSADFPETKKIPPLVIHLKERRFESVPTEAQLLVVPLNSTEATQSLARILATTLVPSTQEGIADPKATVIGLTGDLGSGKTYFVTNFIRTLLPEAEVSSPTYSISQEYVYPSLLIYHLDLYRLQSIDELEGIGFWEFSGLGTLSLIEWVDLYPEALSSEAVVIEFAQKGSERAAYIYSASHSNFEAIALALTGFLDGAGLPFHTVTIPIETQ